MKRKNKKTLKINRNNDIESIIETFQQYEKKYEIVMANLDDGIQYEFEDMKITQTYKSTILEMSIGDLIKKLKNSGSITILITDNIRDKKKNKVINEKIREINTMPNVKTMIVSKNRRYDVLESIMEGG
ncbi:MAG: hypothetical protein BZ137_07505 [Methanosphaera sp. rholeuAM130]|nr:MAG: hypothetical protein BZ137_07505 [Methanosphaera sp. rholeuAM130]